MDPREAWVSAVAPEGLEVLEDRIRYPEGELLPLTVREGRLPGDPARPLARLRLGDLAAVFPGFASVALRREAPDAARQALRARRTLMEGILLALAEKTGRRPSMAEQIQDAALDRAESAVQMGTPSFRAALALAYYAPDGGLAEAVRREAEARLRALGLIPQRFLYVPERALLHLQPGGPFFHGLEEARLLREEVLPLLPDPERPVRPAPDSVWIGRHRRTGRDVFFSFTAGFDPDAPPPAHATVLILGDKGSGKTTLLRLLLLQRLLQGRPILSLDPEGENVPLCRALGGVVVPARPPEDPEACLIHPLDVESPEELLLAARFLLAALGGPAGPEALAALEEAVRRRLARRPGRLRLAHLLEALQALEGSAVAARLAAALRPFAAGGILEGYFDRERALLPVPRPGEWICVDLSGLREETRDLVYAALSLFFFRAVTKETQAPDLFVDEGWRLLRGGPFADLLDEVDRRARKRGAAVVLATHLPEDLAKGRAFGLGASAFLGRLPAESAAAFLRAAGLSEGRAAALGEEIARLVRPVFLALPPDREAAFPVEVRVPPAWLARFRALDPFQRPSAP